MGYVKEIKEQMKQTHVVGRECRVIAGDLLTGLMVNNRYSFVDLVKWIYQHRMKIVSNTIYRVVIFHLRPRYIISKYSRCNA